MATGDYTYRETANGLVPMGQYYPSMSVGYLYIDPTPTSVISSWAVCQKCSACYDSTKIHYCVEPQRTVTTTSNTPHKCPCCDGWGRRNTVAPLDSLSQRLETCPACSGKGVLWE